MFANMYNMVCNSSSFDNICTIIVNYMIVAKCILFMLCMCICLHVVDHTFINTLHTYKGQCTVKFHASSVVVV